MKHLKYLWCGILVTLVTYGCQKPEGYGGTASIEGYLHTRYYNDDYSLLIREAPAIDEEVFLLFGDEAVPGDRVFTGNTGAFRFEFLRSGKYTLYYKSSDSTALASEEYTASIELELQNGEQADLETLFRMETLDFDDGDASISGVIRLVNYTNESVYPFLEVKDTSYAQEQEVYLIYGDHAFYDERIRTDYKGYFEFNQLIPGRYTIFVYSEDLTGGTGDIPVIIETEITSATESIELGEFFIYQL